MNPDEQRRRQQTTATEGSEPLSHVAAADRFGQSASSGASAGDHPRDNPRIEQAMEAYLEQLEAGGHPDRADFLARFPDVARELEGHLEGLDFLHGVAPQVKKGPHQEQERLAPHATLGDFRLVRPIGRGGMGIVYEAEQLSLGRTVAVKVLPFAAMFDSRHLKRFRNEARAAATLDHPNIVPIYFVGHERGVHFYAMQLIERAKPVRAHRGLALGSPGEWQATR